MENEERARLEAEEAKGEEPLTVEEHKEEIKLDMQDKLAEMMGVTVEVQENAEDAPAKKKKKRKGRR